MGRAAYIAAAIAALAAATPALAATGATAAHVMIVEGNVVRMNWSVAMPSVRGTSGAGGGASFSGSQPSMMMGMMMMPGNATLTIRREDESDVPVTAPTSFEVIRNEGDNALIVKTAANSEFLIASDGAIMGGSLQGASAASISVGRGSPQALSIVVQYN